jgi:hypothetical protein
MDEVNYAKEKSLDYKDEKNNEESFANVFSNIGKFEKNKQYQQLQKDLNSLKQDVDLMEDFINKDKLLIKRKKFSNKLNMPNIDKDISNKRKYTRRMNSIIIRKKINMMNNSNHNSDSNITISRTDNKNINRLIYKDINKKDKVKTINNNNKINSLSQKKYKINFNNNSNKIIYKTEVNNYNQYINGEKLPNIYLNSDRKSESNLGSKNTNSNSNSTSRLPMLNERNKGTSPKKLYLFTDNDIDIDNNIYNKDNHNKKNFIYKKIPLIKRNLNDNSIVQKFPNILTSHRTSSLNHKVLIPHTDKIVRKMKEKNVKIKRKINYKLSEHQFIDWKMKSKLKLAQWRYGIAEVQKYFIDLQAYGKPEEDELVKRKTFYDFVDDLINDIKKTKEKKEIKSIEDRYINKSNNINKFGIIKKDEKKNEVHDINLVDNTVNKQLELSEVLEKVKLRKKKEQQKRDLIDNILFKCDIRRKAIDDSTNKINYKKKILNKSKESDKDDKTIKSLENENEDEDEDDKSKNDINIGKINEI